MKDLRTISIALLLSLTSACSQYLVMAGEPRHAGQEHHKALASLAGGTGTSPHPGIVARECGADQLSMVRFERNFGQAILTLLTLGLYAPATIHFRCATAPPPPPGEINTSGDH